MKRIAIATAAIAALTVTAYGGSLKYDALGCSNYNEYKALTRFVVKNDQEAFIKYAVSHDCKFFQHGYEFIQSDYKGDGVCIRTRGDPTCYWVYIGAFNAKE